MYSRNDRNEVPCRGRPEETTRASEPTAARSEEVLIRNYDHQRGYDLHLVVVTPAGDTVFENRYYLQPGETVSERERLPGGDYRVTAVLDDARQQSTYCRIDSSPDGTAVIEVGNGTFSLTAGLHS